MCGNCKDGKCGGMCVGAMIAKILVIVGGINWGLVGIGMLFGKDFNIVHFILSFSATIEAIIYLLVGVAAVMMIFGCKCGKCAGACKATEAKPGENMQ